ncbi:MAG: DNA methyltransferase [Chloroflexota bacterium]
MISELEWDKFLFEINSAPQNSLDVVILLSALIPPSYLYNDRDWLDKSVQALRPGGLLFVQGKPEDLPNLGVYLDERLTFKYWIAVESAPRQVTAGLPSTHIGLLLLSKGKTFDIQKVRFPHQTCQACGRPLRDWGGKAHLMHPDGVAISDVWKDLPLFDNSNALSMPVLETIQKMIPVPPEGLKGLLAPKNDLALYSGIIPSQKAAILEPTSSYHPLPQQYPLPGFGDVNSPSWLNPPHPEGDNQWNRVIQGDIIETLRQFPDESIDLVFADPPYNLDKAYNTYNDEKDRHVYLEWCNAWLDEYIRILKPTGALYLLNLPRWAMYHAQYLNQRLHFQNWIVWDALSEPRGKIMPAHYALLFYTRQPTGFTFNYQDVSPLDSRFYCLRSSCIRQRKQRGENQKEILTDIWWDIHRLKHRRDRDYHPCQLPEALLERIIRLSSNPGDVVLDALAGTGTTAVVAAQLGRQYVAIDVDENYVEITRQKLNQIAAWGNVQRESTRRKRKPFSKKALQLELQELARQLGHLPSQEEVQRLSQYGLEAFLTTFPTWGKALKAAKLEVLDDRTHS